MDFYLDRGLEGEWLVPLTQLFLQFYFPRQKPGNVVLTWRDLCTGWLLLTRTFSFVVVLFFFSILFCFDLLAQNLELKSCHIIPRTQEIPLSVVEIALSTTVIWKSIFKLHFFSFETSVLQKGKNSLCWLYDLNGKARNLWIQEALLLMLWLMLRII